MGPSYQAQGLSPFEGAGRGHDRLAPPDRLLRGVDHALIRRGMLHNTGTVLYARKLRVVALS